jgi:predicted glycogen debranching enzyme
MLTNNNQTSFDDLAGKEWLVTNGIGGYASSSILGANTRRYHGLLVASLNPPTERMVMVSKIEESIVFNRDCVFDISSNKYPGTVHPHGHQYFRFFERKPLPRMKFESEGHHLLKTILMVHGSNTTVVEYENTGESAFKLRLTPLFVFRDYHSLFHQDADFDFRLQQNSHYFTLTSRYGAPALHFNFTSGEFTEQRDWYKNFEYDREKERGLDFREDAYALAKIESFLKPGEKMYLVFSTDASMMDQKPENLKIHEIKRVESLANDKKDDPFLRDLLIAGEQFIVHRESTGSYSLIAGYHWFTDWGRDSMIALRGLCIAPGKQEVTRSILQTFLRYVDKGMLPNRFPDNGRDDVPEYNTIDATLWLFVTLYEYHQKFRDQDFITEVFDTLTNILESHLEGTRYHIHVTPEGFLSGGEGLAQLTWMDARIGDYVVTPRHGCPVEIQALWFNALQIYQYFAGTLGKPYEKYKALGKLVRQNFNRYFVRPDGALYDVVNPGISTDASLRPNQIFVVSLPFALLSPAEEKKVVGHVASQLLTPYGLRTLSPDHPDFKPVYEGDPWHRDTAYHQGTVWPFLLGEYLTAFLKVNDWSAKAKTEALSMLEPVKRHFYQENCIMGISEVFDGYHPQTGKGAVHQAWSVASVLKLLLDLEHHKKKRRTIQPIPNFEKRTLIF